MAIYTPEMLQEFDRLTRKLSSRDQLQRIEGRTAMPKFIELHGKDVCDAMFAELQKRDAKNEA